MTGDKESIEKCQAFAEQRSQTLLNSLGIELTHIEPKLVCARMPVDERTVQPLGLLHGGASVALAETLASMGGWLLVEAQGKTVVGQEINANHLRPMREGFVKGEATPLHLGRRSQVWQIEIKDESTNALVCISRCTLSVINVPN